MHTLAAGGSLFAVAMLLERLKGGHEARALWQLLVGWKSILRQRRFCEAVFPISVLVTELQLTLRRGCVSTVGGFGGCSVFIVTSGYTREWRSRRWRRD